VDCSYLVICALLRKKNNHPRPTQKIKNNSKGNNDFYPGDADEAKALKDPNSMLLFL
jgi:hypothetical protein